MNHMTQKLFEICGYTAWLVIFTCAAGYTLASLLVFMGAFLMFMGGE